MKRKSPIDLSLVVSDPTICYLKTSTVVHLMSINSDMKAKHDRSRTCTPSPIRSTSPAEKKQMVETKSIMRKSKRRKLANYKTCKELVDWDRDESIASDYELILFSHMIMEQGRDPSFRCRLCPKSCASTFSCRATEDLVNNIPSIEQHLLECQSTPSWLGKSLSDARVKHTSQICPRKPYTTLVWKRVLAHAFYSRLGDTKRVKFAKQLCEEHVIPGR